jgi:autotransporter-associated beta strand protein
MKTSMPLSSSISLGVPSPHPRRRLPLLYITTAILLLLLSSTSSTFADSANWKMRPATGDWNHAANWTPPTIPNGPLDTATFASSNTTGVSISANTEVNGIMFNAGASAFTITAGPTLTLTVSGAGITNNSGIAQEFVAATDINGTQHGTIQFTNGATAGNGTRITDSGPEASDAPGGITQFFDSSSAGNAGIRNTIGSGGGFGGGGTEFYDNSNAGNAGFFNAGGRTFIRFFGNSTAGSGDFFNGGTVSFFDGSNAGNGTFSTNNGDVNCQPCAGHVVFADTSTAGNGAFTYAGAETGDGTPSFTSFSGSSSAGNGTFTCSPGFEGGEGSSVGFGDASTADNATFTLEGATDISSGGGVLFGGAATAGNATLIANGGSGGGGGGRIEFLSDSSGGQARLKVFGNGNLDISRHNAPGVSVGSIQGSGLVFLGAFNLTVGSNKLSTNFSGLIQDGGISGGSGGSLTKVGTGTLVLRNSNAYTGGTTINGGKLVVNNESGSGTGSGPVQVNSDRLGGRGIIAGDVTLGDGSGRGAILSPGKSADTRGTLIIASALTFNSDGTYKFELNSDTRNADGVVANGVTINSGAQFSFADVGNGALPLGTVFTAITNTSANPIAGTFSNLADGSTFTSNGNTYQVNYEGGDGNDLTLTVIP